MATPLVPTIPETPTENNENKEVAAHEEMAAHDEVVAHDGMVAHGEVVAHDDDMVAQNEMVAHGEVVARDDMVAQNEMVAHGEVVSHDDMVAQNEMVAHESHEDMIAHDEMVAHGEVMPHNESVVQDEMVAHESNEEMIAHDEMVAHGEVIPHNESVVQDEMVARDEMVAHEEMVAHGEVVAHDDMVTQNEMVACESHEEMIAHNETVGHDEVMAHNEIVVQDEMVAHGELVAHDEMVAHGEMVAHDEMVAHGEMVAHDEMVAHGEMVGHGEMVAHDEMVAHNEMVEHGEMGRHHELVPHDEMLFNNNVINNEIVPMETPMDYIETPPNSLETQPSKRRKKKSIVWEHFTIEAVGNGCRRACCKQCKQSFAYSQGSKVAGTSHLKRHIAKGACPVVLRNQQNNSPYSAPTKLVAYEGSTEPPKRRYRTASTPFFAFDTDRCRHEISRMIIMHEYPLHMVEHPGFVAFVRNLQPRFDMVSFNTVQGDCVATYLREKQALQKVIKEMPGRICLTLDMWSSCLNVGYVFITGQFIDSEWKIHRKILNVIMESYPESDTAFSHAIAACLSDWSMEGKLFSVTINQPLTDNAADNVRALLSVKNALILNGQLLLGNCLAHTLSSIAEDGLKYVHETVKKVRDSVKYVKTSESHEEKFLELKQQLQVPSTKILTLDDKTQWNTTYEMLMAASELKEVFSCLDTYDPDYKDGPSMDEWKKVETLCTYLKILFDTANLLTAPTISTTNTFFHEAWKIQLELARAAASEDPFVSGLTKSMQEKFDKYWNSCYLILAIAVVVDPRFKMKLVEFSFTKIYGEDAAKYVKIVDEGIHELFLEYVALPLPLTPTYIEEANGGAVKNEDEGLSGNGLGFSDFDVYIMETTSQQSKSELDQYLEESLLPRVHEFDVVGWWKVNRKKYPTLSKMARDILTVPICTVPADAVFCTAGKEMSSYRCSLRPETVEALICAKDWLQNEFAENLTQPIKMEVPI